MSGEHRAVRLRMPFGVLEIVSDGRAVTRVAYLPKDTPEQSAGDDVTAQAAREALRYLDDPAFRFTVPLAPRGTAFQRRVWTALSAIPPGRLRTYGDVASDLGSAARAVGQACGSNPLPLVVPCHRVVGARGHLGGFMHAADGDPIAIKRWLLAHEGHRFDA